MFANRVQAGQLLSVKVQQYLVEKNLSFSDVVLAALPRGGVPVALEVARKLGTHIDVIVAKKIPMPDQPEYAIGAASSDGVIVLNPDLPRNADWKRYIDAQTRYLLEKTAQVEEALYKDASYVASDFQNKIVVIVDDGIATGMTTFAAVLTARQRRAAMVIVAAPVISRSAYAELCEVCDGVITLSVPAEFHAVGASYAMFDQTLDTEVTRCMRMSEQFIRSLRV